MTDYPIFEGNLEVRARGNRRVLSGKFPYGATATIRNTGRARKERFAPESMSWQVREFQKLQGELAETIKASIDEARKQLLIEQLEDGLERRNTHLLVGHDYNRAVADMRTGNLSVRHTREAVELEAVLPDESEMPSWVRDAVLAVKGGQLTRGKSGLSSDGEGRGTACARRRRRGFDGAGNPGRRGLRIFASRKTRICVTTTVERKGGRSNDRTPEAADMAVTLTVAQLEAALGIDTEQATRLLGVATELVDRYAPGAPETVKNEAAIRCAGWLAEQPHAAIRSERRGRYFHVLRGNEYERAPS